MLFCFSLTLFSQEKKTYSLNQLQKLPVYLGCKGDNIQLKKCMNKSVQKHIFRKSDVNTLARAKKPARVFILFEISETGKVTNIRIKSSQKSLEKEFIRIMKLLPDFEPGMIDNKPVTVKYTLPFKLQGQINK